MIKKPTDSMRAVVAVIDTVEDIQSHVPPSSPSAQRHQVENPGDVSRRVRQVFQNQHMPLACDDLSSALALHAPSRPLMATKSDTAPVFRPSSSIEVELVLAVGILAALAVGIFVLFPKVVAMSRMEDSTTALVAAAHQGSPSARFTLAAAKPSGALEKLGVTWSLAGPSNHPHITVTHTPIQMALMLSDRLHETGKPNLTMTVNGQPIATGRDVVNASLKNGSPSSFVNLVVSESGENGTQP